MSLATSKPQSLTTISGGISRLRTKGAAARDALFDLVNGYVTSANTVVPRPGTLRNADISAYSGAGMTKGLVGFQGALHVFSHEEVSVPPGYILHVLAHPAGLQSELVPEVATAVESGFTAGGVSAIGSNSDAGQVSGSIGFCANTLIPPTKNVGSIGGVPAGVTVEAFFQTNSSSIDDPNTVYLIIANTFNLNAGWTFSYPSTTNGVITISLTAANLTNVLDYGGAYYVFALGTNPPQYGTPGPSQIELTFGVPASVPIPLKEIHYAQPFAGFLYVVAEFEPNSSAQNTTPNVYHYWVQSTSPTAEWVASTDYQIGDVVLPDTPNGLAYIASRYTAPNPVWTAGTIHALNDKVEPSVPNGFFFTATTVEGANPISGQTEPTWPTMDGAVVQEESTLDNDQSVTLVTSAPQPTTTTAQTKYKQIAGGFGVT